MVVRAIRIETAVPAHVRRLRDLRGSYLYRRGRVVLQSFMSPVVFTPNCHQSRPTPVVRASLAPYPANYFHMGPREGRHRLLLSHVPDSPHFSCSTTQADVEDSPGIVKV